MSDVPLRPNDPLPRLLIVDDVDANREILARMFRNRGFDTVEAEGGHKALEIIACEPLDLVLLDVMMPDMDGFEALRRIREAHSSVELPVIMVTARTESQDIVHALSLGANDYVTKPVDFAVAHARVNALVGRKRAEEEVRRVEERLRASHKLEAIGQLAGGVAHDFNNLLLVIDGYARIALKSPGDPAVVSNALAEVLHAAGKAEGLVRQLLVFSRRQMVDRRILRVSQALSEVEALLRPLLGARNLLQFDLAPGAGDLCVETDPAEFCQAIVNLAINARDAMPGGGTVTIGLRRSDVEAGQESGLAPGAYVELTVQDTGCGMDQATLARIFDPFFTTKDQGKGTGLGLAMVYGFVQQSGGAIAADTDVGFGSTFRLMLPLSDRQPAVEVANVEQALRGAGETVLLVEDDQQLLRLTRSTLEELGYRVLSASNGVEALEIEGEDSQPIDLVLTDVVMPSLGGFDLAAILHDTRPELPVVFMSGYPTGGELKSVSLAEGSIFLPKPFKPAALASAVHRALRSPPDQPSKTEAAA